MVISGLMGRDLQLSPSMITFDNLDELLGSIDDSIETHNRAIDRYSNLLGGILRTTIGGGEGAVPQINLEQPSQPSPREDQKPQGGGSGRFGLFKSQPQNQNAKKPQKSAKPDEAAVLGWTVIESGDFAIRIATGQTAHINQKKTEALFKIVEALKSKVALLEVARKTISELPSRGLRPNQIISVVFKDGIPRQIIPTNESKDSRRKFGFQADFEIEALRSR